MEGYCAIMLFLNDLLLLWDRTVCKKNQCLYDSITDRIMSFVDLLQIESTWSSSNPCFITDQVW